MWFAGLVNFCRVVPGSTAGDIEVDKAAHPIIFPQNIPGSEAGN